MKKLLVIAMSIGVLASCKKSDDNGSSSLPVTAANIVGTYKITGDVSVEGGMTFDKFNGGVPTGYPSQYPDCKKDNTFTFTTNTVSISEGATSCSTPTPNVTLAYSLDPSTKMLKVIGGDSGVVSGLTATKMILTSTTINNIAGSTMTTVKTVTFTKQ
jgi:hypothetical protein